MSKFLVTGGCGFIGSHLCEALLATGHKVIVLDNLSVGKRINLASGAELIVADVTDRAAVRQAMEGADGCFHLAAIPSVQASVEHWSLSHQTNLTGAVNVLEAARYCNNRKRIPVIYASSAAVYGDNASVPLNETDVPTPLTPYGADKLGCELHARVASLMFSIPTVGFRLFNVYGPRQDPNSPYSGVISIFRDRLLQGKSIQIFGDGKQARDFIFVEDAVGFMLKAMLQPKPIPEVYNVCTGQMTTIEQLARIMTTITGKPPLFEYIASRPGDIRLSLGDPRKSYRHLGVSASVNLYEGLRRTLDLRYQNDSIELSLVENS